MMKPKYNIGDVVYVSEYRFTGGSTIYKNFHKMEIINISVDDLDGTFIYNFLYTEDECFSNVNELRDYLIKRINLKRDFEIDQINQEFKKYVKYGIKGGEK